MKQNLNYYKNKREVNISIGFVVEVLLFVLSGFFFACGNWFGFVIFLVAIWLAVIVGDRIAKNAVINFKWGLN